MQGFSNFTCQCQPLYTGTFCELGKLGYLAHINVQIMLILSCTHPKLHWFTQLFKTVKNRQVVTRKLARTRQQSHAFSVQQLILSSWLVQCIIQSIDFSLYVLKVTLKWFQIFHRYWSMCERSMLQQRHLFDTGHRQLHLSMSAPVHWNVLWIGYAKQLFCA